MTPDSETVIPFEKQEMAYWEEGLGISQPEKPSLQ